MHTWDAGFFEELYAGIAGCELFPGWSTRKCGDPAITQLLFSLTHKNGCHTRVPHVACMICAPHLHVLKQGTFSGQCHWCGGPALTYREL